MTFDAPTALILLLPAAALVYWRLVRRGCRREETATLHIWRQALARRGAAVRPRIEWPIEILLEALAALLLVLALAGPRLALGGVDRPRLLVLVDGGGSMTARPRQEEARERLAALEAKARESGESFATETVGDAATSGFASVALALLGAGDERTRVLLLTDRKPVEALPLGVGLALLRRPIRNVGITAAWIDDAAAGGGALVVQVERSASAEGRGVRLVWRRPAPAPVESSRELLLAERVDRVDFPLDGRRPVGRIELETTAGTAWNDDLTADDGLTIDGGGAPWDFEAEGVDAALLDALFALGLPRRESGGRVLLRQGGPPRSNRPTIVIAADGSDGKTSEDADGEIDWLHPALASLPLAAFRIGRSRTLAASGVEALASSGGRVLAIRDETGPTVALAFDPVAEGWAERSVFPLFCRALLEILGWPPEATDPTAIGSLPPGSEVTRAEPAPIGTDLEPGPVLSREGRGREFRGAFLVVAALGLLGACLARGGPKG